MRYQNIESKIWHDEKFLRLSPLQQRLFLYLLTCPHGNFLGIFVLKPSYATGDLDYTPQNYLKDLLKIPSVRFDPETNVIWVVNLLKYSQNYGHWNDKHKKGAIKLLRELPKSKLIQDFIKYYKELLDDVSIGVSIGLSEGESIPYAISETETETETETEYSPNSEKNSDESISLSTLLLLKIRERKPDFHPNPKSNGNLIKAWSKHIRFMLINDKRSPPQIRAVIEWCQADSFWQNNILSTEKLRKQFDQLELKMSKQEDSGYGIYDNGKRVR